MEDVLAWCLSDYRMGQEVLTADDAAVLIIFVFVLLVFHFRQLLHQKGHLLFILLLDQSGFDGWVDRCVRVYNVDVFELVRARSVLQE